MENFLRFLLKFSAYRQENLKYTTRMQRYILDFLGVLLAIGELYVFTAIWLFLGNMAWSSALVHDWRIW